MKGAALRSLWKAIAERIRGGRPGAFRAFILAVVVGIAAAVLTYRLLRSGD
jgi:uncharacterized membrane protein